MKNLSFLFLVVALALGTVACGNKDKGSSGGLSSDPLRVQTTRGIVDLAIQGGIYFQVGAISYKILDPNSAMHNAFNAAQSSGVIVPTISRYNVTISGFFNNGQVVVNQQQQQLPGQYPGQQLPQGQASVSVSTAVWAR